MKQADTPPVKKQRYGTVTTNHVESSYATKEDPYEFQQALVRKAKLEPEATDSKYSFYQRPHHFMKNHKSQLSSKLPIKQQNRKSEKKVDGVSNYTTNDYSELVDFLNNSEHTISHRSQLGHFPNMYKMENTPKEQTNYKMLSNSRKA